MREDSADRRALGGAEEQYALLMECVSDYAILLLDPEGRVATWNAGARRLFGYEEADIVGRHFRRLFTPEDRERGEPEKELETAAAEGRADDERWHARQDGSRFWASGITTALRDQRGRLRGFAQVARDLTERKQAEEALREADRRKDEFLALLGHELRNPLAPICNAVQLLRLRGPADPDLEWSRDLIERQVQHLTRLVDDLLDVTRVKRGKVRLQKERVELATVVAQAVEACRPLIDARRHELTVSHCPTVRLEADPTRLAQVVANLLNNAAKYTPEGGHIRLTATREGGEAVLRVQDDGIGIRPEVLPRVFDLFAQSEHALDRSQGGLGIGLTVVKSLVEMHGGSVQASSEGLARGSEFVVRLPALPETQQTLPAVEVADGGAARSPSRRVLVVDDNVDNADSLAILLRLAGHEVRTVHHSLAVLEVARSFLPEVVLLDIGLPGVSGYELAPRLREQPGLEGVLLVAVTGYGQEEDRRRAREAGFDHHLVKPVEPEELRRLLAARAGARA